MISTVYRIISRTASLKTSADIQFIQSFLARSWGHKKLGKLDKLTKIELLSCNSKPPQSKINIYRLATSFQLGEEHMAKNHPQRQ
jgi:hypothetical protein